MNNPLIIIIIPLIIIIIAVVVISAFAGLFRSELASPTVKGAAGESAVSRILSRLPDEYLVINNVIVPNQQNTSQIDHVIVSPYGIFVIETKNFSGWIFGTEKSKYWKETFRTTGATRFRNPIKQNWSHIYALSEYLNLDRRIFKPIVAFSNKAELHVTSTVPVVYLSQIEGVIYSYMQEIIPSTDVLVIYDKICHANLVGTERGNYHTQSVRENINRQNYLRQQGICPKCGGNLVLRNGRYGQFIGCSNYPSCKYTANLRE